MATTLDMKPHLTETNPFGSWQKEKEHGYSDDQLIEAYESGIEKGITEQQKILRKAFKANIERTTEIAVSLIQYLHNELYITYKDMHLKVHDITNMSIIIGIDEDDYFSENFDAAYIKASELEDLAIEEDLKITFQFIYTEKRHLNFSALASDGYYLHYEKEGTRRA